MVLRFLIRYLANNEKLIQSLADSYPIRKAARFTAQLIMRAKLYQEKAIENVRKNTNDPLSSSQTPVYFSKLFHEQVERLKKIIERRFKQ